ncbi:MAG: CCDC90 family protein [Methylococcaceae bacterium]|nr:CCDC90 family protein [Methylococcaceae bacterium]
MTAIMFDTHEFIKEFKGAGFSEEQAEVITKLQKIAITATLERRNTITIWTIYRPNAI